MPQSQRRRRPQFKTTTWQHKPRFWMETRLRRRVHNLHNELGASAAVLAVASVAVWVVALMAVYPAASVAALQVASGERASAEAAVKVVSLVTTVEVMPL